MFYTHKNEVTGNTGTSFESQEHADQQCAEMDRQLNRNCRGCTNCVSCNNCTDCRDCDKCDHCTSCFACTDCTRCYNESGLYREFNKSGMEDR